jgi:hypothetical protein
VNATNPSPAEPPAGVPSVPAPTPRLRSLARVVFTTFLLTFIASRLLVILIMGRMIPDFFLHVGQTHVHHLNYGICLLCTVAGILLFFQVSDRERWWCAVAYGFSLALTFDEFGMWLHHWITGALVLAATVGFYIMLFKSLDYAGKRVGPRLQQLEEQGPQ